MARALTLSHVAITAENDDTTSETPNKNSMTFLPILLWITEMTHLIPATERTATAASETMPNSVNTRSGNGMSQLKKGDSSAKLVNVRMVHIMKSIFLKFLFFTNFAVAAPPATLSTSVHALTKTTEMIATIIATTISRIGKTSRT
jgi:hypothetical protein